MENAELLWKDACLELEKRLHADIYSRWIKVISFGRVEDNRLYLYVSNDIYQSWLEENYLPIIREAVAVAGGRSFEITFEIRQPAVPIQDDLFDEPSPSRSRPAGGTRRKTVSKTMNGTGIQLNPKNTFNTFVVGPSNDFAHASSLAVAQAPGTAYNPLFIHGGVGLGKTHLMQAIGHEVFAHTRKHIHYLSCETLLNEYIESLQHRRVKNFRDKYRGTELLLIDDIHFLSKTGALQEEFFHTFNVLYDAHKQIVMTSDRPANEISGLEQRLVSRFEWGLVTELMPPDFETRMAILRSKQKTLNFKLPENLLVFIATNIKSNIRRLEGALLKLTSYAALYKKHITPELAENILKCTLDQDQQIPVTINLIQKNVAEFFDIRMADMTSKHRSKNIAVPRQVAMYLCRNMTESSYPEIGAAFGKTHATVLYAHRSIHKKTQRDKQFRQVIEKISQNIETAKLAGAKP